ncbi:MAG: putative toxin-antitoxin system toxin component, PIN family [Proteobacteria bacterium]|nr:putative toxin-antitoxin system toxin component, PIN family [Pseudomonadota bacterium]
MPRLFIVDTNVLAAGLMTREAASPTARILTAMLDGRIAFLLSPALLHEYRTVLLRPKLQRIHGLTSAQLDTVLTDIVANAMWREPLPDALHAASDPGDGHLWALLAQEPAAILVTGDRLLLESPRPGSLAIPPAQCLSLMPA